MEPEMLASLLSNIAVQLRSALSNLHLAAAQLAPAAARETDPELDARAALLDQSYYRVLRLVNDLSAASCFQIPGQWPRQDWDVVEIVGGLCERAASLAELIGLDLRFSCAMDRHVCAVHRKALEELLFQLLSNAMKFTPAGGAVTVELRRDRGRLFLSVSDTGCGIEESRIPTLFDRFLHQEMDAAPHGLGLGLPLCRRIAEGLGGGIVAESRPGSGARFTVSLPDDQLGGGGVSDVEMDYTGGFNQTLLALADAMPPKAFLLRNQN